MPPRWDKFTRSDPGGRTTSAYVFEAVCWYILHGYQVEIAYEGFIAPYRYSYESITVVASMRISILVHLHRGRSTVLDTYAVVGG
jgi:hypothetical protein